MLHVIFFIAVYKIEHVLHGQKMDKLTPPEALNLDGNIADNWRRWKQRYEIFALASGLSGKEPKIQAATFLHVAGTEALKVYNTFTWETDDDKSKVNKITEKFDEYCNPRKNVTWERPICNRFKNEGTNL